MVHYELKLVGDQTHKEGTYVPTESHDSYELVYYRDGYGTSLIGNERISFAPNTFVMIPPNTTHDELHLTDTNVIWLRIKTNENLPAGQFADRYAAVYQTAKNIVEETRVQAVDYKEMISLELHKLAIMINRLRREEHDTKNQSKNFEYVINYFSENFRYKVNIQEMAKQLNYSYDYFQHRFRKITGMSPQQFLISKRIAAAEKMLRVETINCTEIAFRCGFASSAQFSAIFKREKGVTPQQYRKIIKAD